MSCGVWGVGCGVWGVVCGVWGVGCGVWGVGCGVWGVGCETCKLSQECAETAGPPLGLRDVSLGIWV